MSTAALILSRRFPARADQLADARSAVREALAGYGLPEEPAGDVVMAIDEACQNVIRHAYGDRAEGDIVLELGIEAGVLTATLRDFAPPVSPDCMQPRDLDEVRPGGLGTHFMFEVMDEVGFVEPPPAGGGNLLRMVKRIVRP
jgi:sigma-B regulation protein RsbU (phosphoserine phosphatase)